MGAIRFLAAGLCLLLPRAASFLRARRVTLFACPSLALGGSSLPKTIMASKCRGRRGPPRVRIASLIGVLSGSCCRVVPTYDVAGAMERSKPQWVEHRASAAVCQAQNTFTFALTATSTTPHPPKQDQSLCKAELQL